MTFLERAEQAFPGKGQLILDLIQGKTDPETYATVAAWVRDCFNKPQPIALKMLAINEILEGYGVEAIFGEGEKWPDMVYVSMGDTYDTTVVYDYVDAEYYVTTGGDWIEHAEKQGRTYT